MSELVCGLLGFFWFIPHLAMTHLRFVVFILLEYVLHRVGLRYLCYQASAALRQRWDSFPDHRGFLEFIPGSLGVFGFPQYLPQAHAIRFFLHLLRMPKLGEKQILWSQVTLPKSGKVSFAFRNPLPLSSYVFNVGGGIAGAPFTACT